MPGRTPREAVDDYVEPLRDVVHCITFSRLLIQETQRIKPDTPYVVNLNKMEPVQLPGESRIQLTLAQVISVVETSVNTARGSYDVIISNYFYKLADGDDKELLAFHWTPDALGSGEVTFPHLHLGRALTANRTLRGGIDLNKVHIPTDHVSLTAVIRMAITEFGVKPIRSNWQQFLEQAERSHSFEEKSF